MPWHGATALLFKKAFKSLYLMQRHIIIEGQNMHHFFIVVLMFTACTAKTADDTYLPNKIHRTFHEQQTHAQEAATLKDAFEPYRHAKLDPILTNKIPDYDERHPTSGLSKSITVSNGNQLALRLARIPASLKEIPEAREFAHPLSPDAAQRIIDDAPGMVKLYVHAWKAKNYNTIPKTLLVTGRSGTGKTALPVAIAQQCNIPVFKYASPFIANEYDQSGEINLIRIFQRAVKHMPCVVAIDEMQYLALKHKQQPNSDAKILPMIKKLLKASEKLPILFVGLTQEVTPELQGFVKPDKDVIYLKLPNEQQRESIIDILLREIHQGTPTILDNTLNMKTLAQQTKGFNYHQLENAVKKASRTRLVKCHDNPSVAQTISMKDFIEAIEDIKDAPYKLAGTKRPRSWTEFLF